MEILTTLAGSYAKFIPDDIGGTRLDRSSLLDELNKKRVTARIIQVRGLPGSGKSVLMKRAVQQALENGPVLFLKAEQLEGTSWTSYATTNGLAPVPLETLLVEVGATGTPILFIDAIDRIEKQQQPIIIDVIRTIVDSPRLDNWRIIVSLRDTGIESLRNWLGEFLNVLNIATLSLDKLSDQDAETLAQAKPHLRQLLFGSTQVKDIVRRPFFAKVLDQSYAANPNVSTFSPQSEIDLIEDWWKRGGYNETGQRAIDRQQTLLNLARIRARQLSQPIRLSALNSRVYIDELRSDGILQNNREGISVSFAHDIFFEWAFFYVLAEQEAAWLEEIKRCGEPPALARVVELTAQWEYTQGQNWRAYLTETNWMDARSQWLRAWLLGPLGNAYFISDEAQFETAVFADDFHFFRKVLVWFQAEKTIPNPNILTGDFPKEQKQQIADSLSWPSNFSTWKRLITFILHRISKIPEKLYPELIPIFEVWQNALVLIPNPTSHSLLQQCAGWLGDRDQDHLDNVYNLSDFHKALLSLILKASKAEPTFAADYLQRRIALGRIRDNIFQEVMMGSPFLAQSMPELLVNYALIVLREELPDDQVAREKQEFDAAIKRRRQDSRARSSGSFLEAHRNFSHFDWDRLSINDDRQSFRDQSPLKEPFHSLFQSSPENGLRLLRELCNHAITAWRQLHVHTRQVTPIPLELKFPWGTQEFWGNDGEYLWFRSIRAPRAILCGFMALEKWCFAELARNRPVDELIQTIVEGHTCSAILGIVATLVLHTDAISETTLPLFTTQRLLEADHQRLLYDLSLSKPVQKVSLRQQLPKLIVKKGPFNKQLCDALLNFQNNLPFEYEEQRNNPEARQHFMEQALKYEELADPKNYQFCRTETDPNQLAVVHVSPSANAPENSAKRESISQYINALNLCYWVHDSFKKKGIQDTWTIEAAITFAKSIDSSNLFVTVYDDPTQDLDALRIYRGAVAATASITLNFRSGLAKEDLDWARSVLERAMRLPEIFGFMWSPGSVDLHHHGISVARGLSADISEDTDTCTATRDLLNLMAHPLEIVSLAALEECCKLWAKNPKLTWAGLILAFSLCHLSPRPPGQFRQSNEAHHSPDVALLFYQNESDWTSLPLPPPAWINVQANHKQPEIQYYGEYEISDAADAGENWTEPDAFWHSRQAAKILKHIPFDKILSSSANSALLNFLADALKWTNDKNSPPWVKTGRRNKPETDIFEWSQALGECIGHVAGLIPLTDLQTRFLNPILDLESDNCWVLLYPFVETYICTYVYDAKDVPVDAINILELCLTRLLRDSAFDRDAYGSGRFSGFHQPRLVRALMFVSVEQADLSASYVNGDWSEINLILPIINRFIRAGGWVAYVMADFLTLCERAKNHYPAEMFADQVLPIISAGHSNLKDWHETLIPARIAALVQHFAHRDSPMTLPLAQNLLRILDRLVDMGDRRSAALQLSEAFREVRVSA